MRSLFDDDDSFDVDRTGSPVLVKVSHFPNWRVSGARGVRRAAPNFMVVVPTARHATLHYGTTPVDAAAQVLTALGVLGAVLLWRPLRGRRRPPGDEDSARNGGQRRPYVEG